MQIVSKVREPLVTGGKTYKDITEDVCRPVEANPSKGWFGGMALSLFLLLAGGYYLGDMLWNGIGRWGLNKTVQWAWDITNFVWWVGIGHAGTLISAVLLLFRQKWRTSINRAAEAMTIFAVICAAIWPVVHMGRPWIGGIWALPLPNTYGSLWVNFNSPLLWDVFAISTYFSVSLVFWFIGLVPDFATIRDRAIKPIPRLIYGALSMGFNGSAKTWMHYEAVSLILAGLSTPLVLSVHTIVSMDFATSVIPGWHTTIFPPYFVAGAIFSGFAMVLTLMLVTRKLYKLEDYITMEHIEMMSLVVTITGSVVGIAYITEFVIAWYSGVEYEQYAFVNRMTGQYWWAYWSMMACNVISPQVFYVKKLRTNIPFIFFISIVVNIGMWFERFVIIVTSLHRDYLPSSWLYFNPTITDVMCYVFTFGLFFTLFLAFAKYFPVVNMAEVKSVLKDSDSKVYKSRRTISNEVVPEADRVPVDL
ncbi:MULTISPECIES: NrfD/PsrC family molybdoenzyme membrane anchor subunit [Flammeovirga]|uniref:Polysulfide reductase NrfD n=1 Tax=Flammeovirga aprica JL-4 TaxID=694437 RepID=A0A7X9XAT3_9BACT|nr:MULTISPECIES: NrfD/PsrC family molybdoenzyme membrane anchor subunit [Flammeovirga]KXX71651.1 hydrogenase [Flammeovirga sp. SJP92]MBD0401849.1 polysulfide reductase NrfD [Flammeovirga sp. EKP202]NME69928.1 polysulfide reductase NrfD [Flammeovirga aprica JL-4]